MNADALIFLRQLLETPSPSGYEQRIQQMVREYVAPFADSTTTDVHGNVIVARNPEAPLRVMLAGHCDQIGLIVQYIDDARLPLRPADRRLGSDRADRPEDDDLDGRRAGVRRDCPQADPPAHRRRAEEGAEDQGPVARHRRKNKEEAAELVRIGDPVTLELGFTPMRNNLASSPGMDDKTGLWVAIEALRRTRRQAAQVRVLRRLDGAGGNRPARRDDQHLRHQSARRHRRRRDARHRLPDDRQEAGGRHRPGRGPVIFRGPNMNPQVVDRLLETATAGGVAVSDGGQRPGHAAPTPTPCRSAAAAWPPAWSAFPIATCTARWR